MNKNWEDINIGDRIKCLNYTHGMFGKTGIITAKDADAMSNSKISVKWDNLSNKNCCYFGSFEVINAVYDILNGGEQV